MTPWPPFWPGTRDPGEVEALLERTEAMEGWLEVTEECHCATPAECAVFTAAVARPLT